MGGLQRGLWWKRPTCRGMNFHTFQPPWNFAVKFHEISWKLVKFQETVKKIPFTNKPLWITFLLATTVTQIEHAVSNTAMQGGPSAVHHRIFTWTKPEAGKNSSTLANLLCQWTWSKAVPILGLPTATAENSFSLGLCEKSTTYLSALQNQLEWTCLEAGVTPPLSMHLNASNFSARSSSAFVK